MMHKPKKKYPTNSKRKISPAKARKTLFTSPLTREILLIYSYFDDYCYRLFCQLTAQILFHFFLDFIAADAKAEEVI